MTKRSVNEASIVALRDNAMAMLMQGIWHNVGLTTLDKTPAPGGQPQRLHRGARDGARHAGRPFVPRPRLGFASRLPVMWIEITEAGREAIAG
jgi:hypothetical protein